MYNNVIALVDCFDRLDAMEQQNWHATYAAITERRPYSTISTKAAYNWSVCQDCGSVHPIQDCICALDYVF